MFLFQICVIALCGVRHCQTTITLEIIRNLQRTEWKFMSLVFSGTTCYAQEPGQPRICCVSIPNVLVDYEQYEVIPPFTVTGDLSYNILFTGNSPATVLQGTVSYMAFIRQSYSGPAVNQPLYTVMEQCIDNASYVEAFIRFMNVIESVGVSTLGRICRISSFIIKTKSEQKAVDLHFKRIDPVIEHIKNKFKRYLISTESVRQIEVAIEVLRMDTKTLVERNGRKEMTTLKARKKFFNDVCMEFSQRYANMMDLVDTGIYATIYSISSIYKAKEEFERILKSAIEYFANEMDAGPIGDGDRLNVQNQLQSECIQFNIYG